MCKELLYDIERRLLKNEYLVKIMNPNIKPPENIRLIFNQIFGVVLNEIINGNLELYGKIVDNKDLNKGFKSSMFKDIYQKLMKKHEQD